MPSTSRRQSAEQRSTSSAMPSRPSDRSAAYTGIARARRDHSGFQSIDVRSACSVM